MRRQAHFLQRLAASLIGRAATAVIARIEALQDQANKRGER